MSVASFLERFSRWVTGRPEVVAAALVGSHARGNAMPGSDVDLVILCEVPDDMLAGEWPRMFGELESRAIEDYGALRSLRVHYRDGVVVEFGFARPGWAGVPLDAGTRVVLADGARILHDPCRILQAAKRAAALAVTLGNGPVSLMFARRGIFQLDHAARHVQALPYGRTSEPGEPLSVLREDIGTCTLKHALLKLAAEEAGATDVELRFGVFEMSDATHPGIGRVLRSHGLECVPEAHCYLALGGDRLDFTGLPSGSESPFAHLLTEESLAVSTVLKEKARRHRAICLDPAAVWKAREACISELASCGR